MRAISPELEALLKARFQAGMSGFRARVEIDRWELVEVGGGAESNRALGGTCTASGTIPPVNPANAIDGNLATVSTRNSGVTSGTNTSYWIVDCGAAYTVNRIVLLGGHYNLSAASIYGIWGSDNGTDWTLISTSYSVHSPSKTHTYTFAADQTYRYWRTGYTWTSGLAYYEYQDLLEFQIPGTVPLTMEEQITTTELRPIRVSLDKSLRMVADQAEVELANEDLPLGWGPTSEIPTSTRLRVYQWYGDETNAVKTFTGLVDRVRDTRDPLRVVLTARDMMALLTDQTFSAHAPQDADEDGADLTPANGVYLSMEVSDIVADILDRVGFPEADRVITPTSYVLDRFVIRDGQSYDSAIRGDEQLTGLVGYDLWADADGKIHFAPTAAADVLTDPGEPDYTYEVGSDGTTELTSAHVTSLVNETHQYALRTRVKVRGPLTTLRDAWTEQWRTSKLSSPVGIWYDPTAPEQIRVLNKSDRRLYRLRQSDREVLGYASLGAVIASPIGLSGDPSDATIYWVLHAPWAYGGATSGNSIRKMRKSDHVQLASYSIPNGRWSAIKVSGAYIYLTNLDTDRVYRRSKTDASAVDDFNHTVNSVAQLNPSGIMINGTTLHTFWYNSGGTPRFLVSEESAPGTVTRTIVTAGVNLVGGEMDTTTGTECWGGSDLVGLVAKFTLVEPVTNEVAVEVIDADLEDELGALAQAEPRQHDAHPGDPDHPYIVRRETLNLAVVTSLAQATQTAQRRLEQLARRARVLDMGIVGNPALEKADVIRVVDPVTGLDARYVADTIRTEMDAGGMYVATLALVPAGPDATETPEDDGEASE